MSPSEGFLVFLYPQDKIIASWLTAGLYSFCQLVRLSDHLTYASACQIRLRSCTQEQDL